MALADRIAAALHELDDALQSGALALAQVERLRAVRELRTQARPGPRRARRDASCVQRDPPRTDAPVRHRGRAVLRAGAGPLRRAARHRAAPRFPRRRGPGRARRRDRPAARGRADAARHRGLPRRACAARCRGRPRRRSRVARRCSGSSPRTTPTRRCSTTTCCCATRRTRARGSCATFHAARVDAEVERYRRDPRFVRVLADHVAAMTDAFALAEHARLLEMGAVPIPSAEQLRRERRTPRRKNAGASCPPAEDRLR